MIPKIIHYCWFGKSKLPKESIEFIEEWSTLNPDWEIILWNEENSPLEVPYMQSALEGGHFSNISNFIRVHALKEYGGVYLDTDVKLVKPLDTLLDDSCFFGFEEGSEGSETFWVNNAICGAERGNLFIQECYNNLLKKFDGNEFSNLSGPRSTTELLKNLRGLKHYGLQKLEDVKLYPKEYFYPIHYTEAFKLNYLEKHLSPETIAVHVWARTWLTNEMLLDIVDDLYEQQVINGLSSAKEVRNNNNSLEPASPYNQGIHYNIKESINSISYDFLFLRNIIESLSDENNKLKISMSLMEEKVRGAQIEVVSHKFEKELISKEVQIFSFENETLKRELQNQKIFVEELHDNIEQYKSSLVAEKEAAHKAQSLALSHKSAFEILEIDKQGLANEIILLQDKITNLVSSNEAFGNQVKQDSEDKELLISEIAFLQDTISKLISANEALEQQSNQDKLVYNAEKDTVIKLKNEVKYLNQALSWYKQTYEDRRIEGILKDKIKSRISSSKVLNDWVKGYHKLKKAEQKTSITKKVLCSIVNYNCNSNALKLRNNLSRFFDTIVLDSGSTETNKTFINLGNVYYSGLLNNSYQYAKEKGYEFLFFICSDVEFNEEEVEKMVSNLSEINLHEIGLYSPSSRGRSHSFCKKVNQNGLRPVPFTEGFVFLCSIEVLDQFMPIDLNVNLFGWGLDVTKGFFARKIGKLCVIDDGVELFHPESTGYSNEKAELDMWHWLNTFDDPGFKNFFYKHISLLRSGQAEKLKVSIIIPCYNQSPYLKETLYSVLKQEYTCFEVLVIDDGSTDDSAQIIKEFSRIYPVISYHHKNNGGLGNTRNHGLELAKGDFIQFLDADDLLSGDKLLNQIHGIVNGDSIEVSYTPYLCFEHENPTNTWTYSRVVLNQEPTLDLIQNWEKDLSIPVHCFLIKKTVLSELRFDEELPNHEDWLFHLLVASYSPKYHFENSGLAYYRVRNNSMARDKSLMEYGKKLCLEKAICSNRFNAYLVEELIKRINENQS